MTDPSSRQRGRPYSIKQYSYVNRNKYPVVRPSWALKPGLTDRLVVGRKVTLTLTLAVQVTNTDDRPDLSSEGVPDTDKTVNVKQKLISGHETQMGLGTKTD
jgi:hypothetical protein